VTAQEQARATRRAAGLFHLPERGLLRVAGGDRVRWLDGMLSNDVTTLVPGPAASGCYAALLTRQGRIVADFHVLLREEAFWLETARTAVETAQETLERFIIADDVALADASADWQRLGLEGPRAPEILDSAVGGALSLAPHACAAASLAGVSVVVAAFGWSGEPARQLFVPAGDAGRVAEALLATGGPHGLVEGGHEALEILRVEAGVPAFGSELDEEVLPAEARLESAVSHTKGCYTGQEVVARMHSRGRVGHLLVGLRAPDAVPAVGAEVRVGDRRVGEVTSACRSPAAGPIALAYVRSQHAEPGTRVEVDGAFAEVAALPFAAAPGE